jgi:hypothetical protein
MLGVRRLAANLAGVDVRRTVDPMEAVARGAALQAAVMEGLAFGLAVEDTWQTQLRAAYRKLELELAERERRGEGGVGEAAADEVKFPDLPDDENVQVDEVIVWVDEEGNEIS